MQIVRIWHKGQARWAVKKDKTAHLLLGTPFGKIKYSGQKASLEHSKLLAAAAPSKIVMVGLNYRKHAKELGLKIPKQPVLFLKPPSSIAAAGEKIVYPQGVKRLDYEAELAFVVKKTARNIDQKNAEEYILGYTCCNDVTARDLQKKDGQWTRAKSFDTFCPLGPHLETEIQPDNLNIRSYLNGKLKQDSTTADFIFPVYYLLAFISQVMTLLPGDVISTGTPQGIGRMEKRDEIEIQISGIGSLKNQVS